MRVPETSVPIEFRRRAVQHLESVVDTPMAPSGSQGADIRDEVCPIYRPDLPDVAYWEFEVDVDGRPGPHVLVTSAATATPDLTEELRGSASAGGEPAAGAPERGGFIIVSTGEHDFPVPHWSLQRLAVSRQLEMEARDKGATIARIYKIDALAYVGEDEAGEEVARTGELPLPREGLGHDLERHAGEISSLTAKPGRVADEGNPRAIKHSVERTGPKPPDIRAADPEAWPRFKERYADSFGPFLDVLRGRAQEPWRINKLVAEFGEGVLAGDTIPLGLLRREAVVEVTGEGAAFVETELEERPGQRPRLHVKTKRSPHGRETDFEVRVRYADGEEETLRYFIVSRDTPSNERAPREPGGGPR
jgi:hypothetical protein